MLPRRSARITSLSRGASVPVACGDTETWPLTRAGMKRVMYYNSKDFQREIRRNFLRDFPRETAREECSS